VGSCFEVFIVKNLMVRSEFNFDVWFVIYRFCMLALFPSTTQREFVAEAVYKSTRVA
jgi:hypothetical protein